MDLLKGILEQLGEGVPTEIVFQRVKDRLTDDNDWRTVAQSLGIVRENLREDVAIPMEILDDEDLYAKVRSRAKDMLPRLERLIGMLATEGQSRN